ncbi:MAG: antitoxin [Betaproteobacteria bacterium]|nr:antitoxin [Betaproteobacteria bacterium]
MDTAKLFQNGRSQAVRLPKEFRFEGSEVAIRKVGDAVVLLPLNQSWDALFQSLHAFEPGFKIERNQPKAQQKRAAMFK